MQIKNLGTFSYEQVYHSYLSLKIHASSRDSCCNCIQKRLSKILSANMKLITADLALRPNSLLTMYNIYISKQ